MSEKYNLVFLIENEFEEEFLLENILFIKEKSIVISKVKLKHLEKYFLIDKKDNDINVFIFNNFKIDYFIILKPYETIQIQNDTVSFPNNDNNLDIRIEIVHNTNNSVIWENRLFYKNYSPEVLHLLLSIFSNLQIIDYGINYPEIETFKLEKYIEQYKFGDKKLSTLLYLSKKRYLNISLESLIPKLENLTKDLGDIEKEKLIIDLYIQITNKYFKEKKLLAALNILKECQKKYTHSLTINYLLGELYNEKNLLTKAITYFKKCVNLIENNTYSKYHQFSKNLLVYSPYSSLGKSYFKLKDYLRAKYYFEISLKKFPYKNPLNELHNKVKFLLAKNFEYSYPNWEILLKKDTYNWNKLKNNIKENDNSPKILITSINGRSYVEAINSLLAVALTLREAEVHILICDQALSACELVHHSKEGNIENFNYKDINDFIKNGIEQSCNFCFSPSFNMFSKLGLKIIKYSEILSNKELIEIKNISETLSFEEIKSYKYENFEIGEHILAGTLRFFARGTLENNSENNIVLRKYLYSGLKVTLIIKKLINEYNYQNIVSHHGLYVPHGIIGEVSRKLDTNFTSWCAAYRRQRFIFSHNDTYHKTLMYEDEKYWENIPWNKNIENKTMEYLTSRYSGKYDWINFHSKNNEIEIKDIENTFGIDFSKPTIGLLTNVIWDAQLHYPESIFKNMMEWLIETIKYFQKRNDIQLIIRVHPAEKNGLIIANQKVKDELLDYFNSLPSNIFLIDSEIDLNTYNIMEKCNSVIIFGTKTGVELSALGIPIIVAGEAWVKNKGITIDPKSKEEYFQLLEKLPFRERLSNKKTQRARKYAFHYFFRRMIPINFIDNVKSLGSYIININNINELFPDINPGLDIICNGILKKSEFFYPIEEFENLD